MVILKDKIKIEKIPDNTANINTNIRQEFESMPRMYLELIENKEKIKFEVANKEFEPKDLDTIDSSILEYPKVLSDNEDDASDFAMSDDDLFTRKEDKVDKDRDYDRRDDRDRDRDRDYDRDRRDRDYDRDHRDDRDRDYDRDRRDRDYDRRDDRDDRDKDSSEYKLEEFLKTGDLFSDLKESPGKESPYKFSESYKFEDAPGSDQQKSVNNRLLELLQGDDSDDERGHSSKQYNRRSFDNYQKIRQEPPRLSDINEVYKSSSPEHGGQVSKEAEDEDKRHLLFKFDMLRKSYPSESIPEFSMHSDYMNMRNAYENCLKRISIETNADKYKTYLIGSFMIIEYVMGYYMSFDMEGFAQQQIASMSSYERLLVELGEKQYLPEDQQWPVEIRLLFLIVTNTCIFLIGKMIAKKTGADILGMINNMNLANKPRAQKVGQTQPKKKMQGPDIDLSQF